MPPAGMPAPAPRKNVGRSCLTAALAVIGAFALLGGGGLVAHAYANHSQVINNRSAFGPSMWRNVPATKLFPETLSDKQGPQGKATDRKSAQWHRLGISEKTGCDDGLSGNMATEAKESGCKAVLRATYVDPTGNTVATVALIVLPKGADPENLHGFFGDEQFENPLDDYVKAYGVPGTAAAGWSDARRNGSDGDTASGLPYALAASAGAVDGRKAGKLPGEWGDHRLDVKSDREAWTGAASSLVDTLNTHLGDLLMEETS